MESVKYGARYKGRLVKNPEMPYAFKSVCKDNSLQRALS